MRALLAPTLALLLAGCAGGADVLGAASTAPARGTSPALDEAETVFVYQGPFLTVSGGGGGARLLLREGDARVVATAEWEAATPLAQAMRLSIVARHGEVLAEGEGASPLVVEANVSRLEAGRAVEAVVAAAGTSVLVQQSVRLTLELGWGAPEEAAGET